MSMEVRVIKSNAPIRNANAIFVKDVQIDQSFRRCTRYHSVSVVVERTSLDRSDGLLMSLRELWDHYSVSQFSMYVIGDDFT